MTIAYLEEQLSKTLDSAGLSVLGWFAMFDGPPNFEGRPAVLLGNRGCAMWQAFQASQFARNHIDPLDRWTKSIVEPLARTLGAQTLYPFRDDEITTRYWPFQRWACQATGLRQSPPGLLIDPEYGLWQAFRAVLVFEQPLELPPRPETSFACDSCIKRPCLATCPVDAITAGEFKVSSCRDHVNSTKGAKCRENGCIARNACPVGREHAYSKEQQAFHMRAYL